MLKKKDLWTLYLFYDGKLIKKLKVHGSTPIAEQTYFIKVYGHKKLFGKNIVGLMVQPTRLLKTDEDKKKTYWGVVDVKGVEIK